MGNAQNPIDEYYRSILESNNKKHLILRGELERFLSVLRRGDFRKKKEERKREKRVSTYMRRFRHRSDAILLSEDGGMDH